MGPTGKIARLRGRHPISRSDNSGNIYAFAPEVLEQRAAGFISPYDTHREHAGAEVGEIIDGICCSAGIGFRSAMTEDENRRFAGNTGNFAGNKLVENKIAENANCLAGECGDDVEQAGEVNTRSRSLPMRNRRGRLCLTVRSLQEFSRIKRGFSAAPKSITTSLGAANERRGFAGRAEAHEFIVRFPAEVGRFP